MARIQGYDFRFNSMGGRGPVVSKSKPPDTVRIICMGDSVTMGWRVAEEDSFCRLLEGDLRLFSGKKVETVNLGVLGYTTYQGLHQLRTKVLDLNPDFIIINYNWNDHSPALTISSESQDPKQRHGQIADKDLDQPNLAGRIIQKLSTLATFRALQMAVVGIGSIVETPGSTPHAEENPDDLLRVSLQDFRENLGEMIHVSQAHGITPILLAEPVTLGIPAIGPNRALAAKNAQRQFPYNAAIRDVARSQGVVCVNADRAFERRKGESLFFDAVHPTPAGQRVIADELARVLRARYAGLFGR